MTSPDDPLDLDETATASEPTDARTPDNYHRGVIARIYYGSETGTLRSETSGREFRFKWPFVEIRGPIPRLDGLREGMVVGFDLGWTSHGERVTVIKVHD